MYMHGKTKTNLIVSLISFLKKRKKVSDSYCVQCKEMFVTNKEGFK